MFHRYSSLPVLVAVLVAAAGFSCSGPQITGNPILVDPESVSRESGSTEEIYQVSQATVANFLGCKGLNQDERYTIALAGIVNRTGIKEYDQRVFYNRLLAELINKAGDRFAFLDRDSVKAERSAQAQGTVEATGGSQRALKGADLTLTIELRHLRGAGTKTLQYSVKVTALDGTIPCIFTDEIKKRS